MGEIAANPGQCCPTNCPLLHIYIVYRLKHAIGNIFQSKWLIISTTNIYNLHLFIFLTLIIVFTPGARVCWSGESLEGRGGLRSISQWTQNSLVLQISICHLDLHWSLGRWRNPEEVSTVSFTNPLASRSGTFQVRRRTCLVSAIFPNNWQRKIRLRRRVLENHFEVANRFLFQHILSNIKGCGWRVDQYVPSLPTGGSPLKRF